MPTRTLPLLALASLAAAQGPDPNDTRLLADPALGTEHTAFVYADDLWVCRHDGSGVRRLTNHVGRESNPRFSRDGKWLAFTGQYDGNVDVFVVPVAGGEPKRLTWHPGPDVVQDFSADGKAILFSSPRSVYTRRFTQLFEVPIDGGHPRSLSIPNATNASYSVDGSKIAYNPLGDAFRQWKNYRGGRTSRIWLYDRADHSVEQVPQPEGRCNDTDPMWVNDRVYFLSDRNGEFNLFAYDLANKSVRQLTEYKDFPILAASAGASRIAYEQAGWLHQFDPAAQTTARMKIGVATDLIEPRPRWVTDDAYIRNVDISPSGARAVAEYRGEIITVPAKKGSPRNLTQTTGTNERNPVWSPDGSRIAYLSDADGEYQIHVVPQRGQADPTVYPLQGSGFYDSLSWSPDAEKLAFSDNSWTLHWLDLDTGKTTKVATEPIYGPQKLQSHAWSPDSRWIAYSRLTPTYFRQVFVYSLDEDRSWPVTDGLSDVGDPAFDDSGKYLFMLASTDAGPVRQWFAMSNADMEITHAIYLAVLQKGIVSPLQRESDEEATSTTEDPAPDFTEAGTDNVATETTDARLRIDFEGLDQRILALPIDSGRITGLRAGADGKIFYLKSESARGRSRGGSGDLRMFDLDARKAETIATGVRDFRISANHEKLLVQTGSGMSIIDAKPKADLGKGKLATDQIEVRIDPRAEWRQIFDEAWRINRDWFYAPNMHGCDWPEMRAKYSVFLPHLATRSDLNRVIQWMCSELAVGHHRVSGGDRLHEVETVPVGLLGCDYEVHRGRYRFAKVYGGLNWNRTMRSPLTEPGVDVRAGEYLLAVDGRDLRAPAQNLHRRFENKVDRIVELTVGLSPDGTGSRTVQVAPIASESSLRNRDWVEGNIRRVDEATGGRVAYVYVPNTSSSGHTYFKRYFFPQAHKQAIIVDERHNGGGQIADYYVDMLARPTLSWWATRYGQDFKGPLASIAGPRVLLIDETAGSGGDLFPYMFRRMKLGPLIGRRTWGGLVGTLGFPALMDGGRVTAPNLAFWDENGFRVENEGVAPDIEVEQLPAEVIAGKDPQLEKAIEVILKMLGDDPVQQPKRPDYPVRARK